jgi:hypothetical protein
MLRHAAEYETAVEHERALTAASAQAVCIRLPHGALPKSWPASTEPQQRRQGH